MIKIIIRITLFVAIVATGTLYFTEVTKLSTTGETILTLRHELTEIEKKNRSLTVDISQEYDLRSVETLAKENGLVPNTQFVYVKTPSSFVVSKK